MRRPRTIAAVAMIAASAAVLAGCSGTKGGSSTTTSSASYGAAITGVVNPSTKQGGTLKLLADADCDSWDPGRTYYGWCWNMQRLFTRSLVGFSVVNGSKPKVVGDLASALGKHNADFTQWTYTLRPGLKFSNGAAITPQDVKYGVERLFATDVINGGPASYYLSLIKHPSKYAGPYKSGDLDTITTTGNSITFDLSSPFADFDYIMALPAAAPVPNKTEGGTGYVGATYGKKPVASGPFVISSYTQNKSVVFTRNKYWSAKTDPFRKPLAKEIDLTIDTSPSDIDQKLKAGTYDAKMNIDVGSALQTAILTNNTLKKNADDAPTPFNRFFTIYPSTIPNQHCRAAIEYATNKAAILQAYGGPLHGAIAGSVTPITIPGYDKSAVTYASGPKGEGDVAKAKQELQACGKPSGFSTKFAYSTPGETGPKVFQAEQTALARVGIKVTQATSDASNYYSTFVGSPRNVKNQGIGISIYGWGADFPTGFGFWQSIANGNAILQTGNSNQPSLNDPVVNAILKQSLNGKATAADFADLDKQVMKNAVYMPIFFGKTLWYRNPRLTNITCDNALGFGAYDVVNVGVSSGS